MSEKYPACTEAGMAQRLVDLEAEVERLNKAHAYSEASFAVAQGEIERLRADGLSVVNSLRRAEGRLREVVEAVTVPLMTGEAKRLRERVLAAAQPEDPHE